MSQFLYLVLSLAVNRVAEAASGSARNLSGIPCGQPGGGSPFRQGRIMGGTAADIFEFPYAVSLRNNVNEHYCAGSLVSLFFVFVLLCGTSQCLKITQKSLILQLKLQIQHRNLGLYFNLSIFNMFHSKHLKQI